MFLTPEKLVVRIPSDSLLRCFVPLFVQNNEYLKASGWYFEPAVTTPIPAFSLENQAAPLVNSICLTIEVEDDIDNDILMEDIDTIGDELSELDFNSSP